MRLGEYTASIVVDGRALEEYDIVMESATKAACWVASEEGKNFGVRWTCHSKKRRMASSGEVKVDGITCGGYNIKPGRLGESDTRTRSHVSSATKTRDFVFSRLQLSDDETLLNKTVPKELGEISLTIEHGSIIPIPAHAARSVSKLPDVDGRFHETSKKATAHHVSFGPEKTRKPPTKKDSFLRGHGPTLVFTFKYGPLDVLQANGITPPPVTATRNSRLRVEPDDSDIEVTDGYTGDINPAGLDKEIKGLEKKLKRLRNQQAGASEDRKPKRVKKEEPGTEPRPIFFPGEVIDLT